MSAVIVTKENFESEVARSDKPVLLDFWAEWCTPCKIIAHTIDEIAADHPEIKVCKVNVDTEKELAQQFKVMSIPSLFVMRGGEVVRQSVGTKSKAEILEMFLP